MTQEEYKRLYNKYNSGKCTANELEALENYRDGIDLDQHEWNERLMGNPDQVKESIKADLFDNIQSRNRKRIILIRTWYATAAMAILVLSSALYFLNFNKTESALVVTKPERFKNDVLPGSNKAVLTLDDGSQINLDEAQEGVLANDNNIAIKKTGEGQLEYSSGENLVTTVKYNTLSTPMGGQYQLALPDGSKVWLNSGSSIRYPIAFTGSERVIELKGEAYFEIAKNKKMPFIVRTNNSMDIKVLGTQFNVMAYENEKNVNTTLIEGSVEVLKESGITLLEPGQAAVLNKGTGKIKVSNVDVEEAIAWKNGYFIFPNENIESIMRKVSRWYNIDVTYEGNLSNKDFVGTISRDKKISEILKMLELTGAVHFRIEGRRITVMP